MATVNEASKLTTPAIRRCYAPAVNTPCSEITSITGVVDNATSALPVFITRATNVLTISPTSNLQSKTYTLKINQTVANIADRVWTTVTVTVTDCLIRSFKTEHQLKRPRFRINPSLWVYINVSHHMDYPCRSSNRSECFSALPD